MFALNCGACTEDVTSVCVIFVSPASFCVCFIQSFCLSCTCNNFQSLLTFFSLQCPPLLSHQNHHHQLYFKNVYIIYEYLISMRHQERMVSLGWGVGRFHLFGDKWNCNQFSPIKPVHLYSKPNAMNTPEQIHRIRILCAIDAEDANKIIH